MPEKEAITSVLKLHFIRIFRKYKDRKSVETNIEYNFQ